MDAPPQNESIESFLKIGKMLNSIEVNVPHIYQEDRALGFILMQDFGRDTYLDVLNDDNQQRLYSDSIGSLIQMQKLVKKDLCQSYTQKILFDEMTLFIEWYLKKYKKIELTNKENERLLNSFEENFIIIDIAETKGWTTAFVTGGGISLKEVDPKSFASKILENFESLFSATAINRLLQEDAIIIGRLNCDEFAMGSSNENSAFGPVKNPLDTSKVPGGSSGGSAAAVAAGLCHAALGSDTGGSIRQPASFCGVVGLKPSYGRISRYGLIAYGSSLDQIGPLTNSVDDAALLLEVMGGPDGMDTTAFQEPMENLFPLQEGSSPKNIVFLGDAVNHPNTDPEIVSKTKGLAEKLETLGHHVSFKSFDLIDHLVPAYNVISNAEASSNLSRYDGVHYGYRSKDATDMETTYFKSRSEGFGWEVKRRIMLGTFVLSAGYHDAYFTKAQKIRRLIKDKTNEMFEEYDFVVSPTTPHTPFEIGKKQTDPTVMYLEDIFTVQANLAGNPAISLPLGKHSNGLPIGLHLMADNFKEADLFAFSKYLSN